jgi:hypothetical protein
MYTGPGSAGGSTSGLVAGLDFTATGFDVATGAGAGRSCGGSDDELQPMAIKATTTLRMTVTIGHRDESHHSDPGTTNSASSLD